MVIETADYLVGMNIGNSDAFHTYSKPRNRAWPTSNVSHTCDDNWIRHHTIALRQLWSGPFWACLLAFLVFLVSVRSVRYWSKSPLSSPGSRTLHCVLRLVWIVDIPQLSPVAFISRVCWANHSLRLTTLLPMDFAHSHARPQQRMECLLCGRSDCSVDNLRHYSRFMKMKMLYLCLRS